MRLVLGKWALVAGVALGAATMADAAPVLFVASDLNVGNDGGPRPNSDAAAAAFDAAAAGLGDLNILNLEGLSTGFVPNIALGGGVNASFFNVEPAFSGIRTSPGASGTTGDLGFATSGTKFLQVSPLSSGPDVLLALTFSHPVHGFGAYFTGLENTIDGSVTLNFFDGSSQTLALPEPGGNGGHVTFFGFTSAGAAVNSIVIREEGPFTGERDIWGMDDVRVATPVPVPASVGLGVVGMAMVGGLSYLRRRRRQA